MLVQQSKWFLAGTQRYVTNCTQHDDAKKHGDRLQPHHAKAHDHAKVQGSRKRTTAQRNCPLQPSRTGQLCVGRNCRTEAFGLRFQDLLS